MKAHDRHLAYGTAADCSDDALDILWVDHLAGGEPRTSQLTGTKALMLAVFEDGIRCYLGGGKRIAAEAEDWLNSGRRSSPFVFVVLCETFGLDPQAVRQTVKQMKREHRSPSEIIPRVRNNVRVPGRVSLRKRRRHRRSAYAAPCTSYAATRCSVHPTALGLVRENGRRYSDKTLARVVRQALRARSAEQVLARKPFATACHASRAAQGGGGVRV